MKTHRRSLVLFTAALLAGSLLPAVAGSAQTGDTFTCRASVVRVEHPIEALNPVEPIVANEQQDPCVSETAQPVPTLDLGPLGSVRVLFAETEQDEGQASSGAGVADIRLVVTDEEGTEHLIEAQILTAEAAATCPSDGGPPAFSGDSTVVGLEIDGNRVEVPDGEFTLDLSPLLILHLNESETTDGAHPTHTRRAFRLDVLPADEGEPVARVVIAEAIVDFSGNPCADGPPPPPPPPPLDLVRWMTGGGTILDSDGLLQGQSAEVELHRSGVLQCDPADKPNRMVVKWGDQMFKLERMTAAACTQEGSTSSEPPPGTSWNTHRGEGIGTCGRGNDRSEASIEWTFRDHGEPGTMDEIEIAITGEGCDVAAAGNLIRGNLQAHERPAPGGNKQGGGQGRGPR